VRIGTAFGELNYSFGRTRDGITRTAGALTTEETYRLVRGYPDVYVTSLYRWAELPIASYLSAQSIRLGKRLGKNTLIVPFDGSEEEYWRDARALIGRVVPDAPVLDDGRVYLLLSACNPQSLPENDLPFVICDIGDLRQMEFVGFMSKLLDLFDVDLEFNLLGRNRNLPTSPGRALLEPHASTGNEEATAAVGEALRVLVEITFVLEKLRTRFFRFRWPIQEAIDRSLEAINANLEERERLTAIRKRFVDGSDGAREPRGEGDPKLHRTPRVFLSYVKEDARVVERLVDELAAHGIHVWLDREQLLPGQRWPEAIRRAISEGDFFLACFSEHYASRSKTYMNEELTLAIDELRQRPADRTWFLPVVLSECEIPDRNIGAGQTLRSIQWVRLDQQWKEGIGRIVQAILSS
jgi:hypothetical protein